MVIFKGQWHIITPSHNRDGKGYYATPNDGLNFIRKNEVRVKAKDDWLGNMILQDRDVYFFGTGLVAKTNNFIDWDLIDECISIASLNHKYDYVSTILSNSFPIGQHVEVFKSDLISLLNSKALDPIHREHVTPYIYQNRNLFNIYSMSSEIDLSCYRLTIDYEQDYLMFQELIGKLNEQLPPFKSIIDVLKKFPDISSINSHLQKSQYIKK